MLGRDEIVQKARCIQDTFLIIKLHSDLLPLSPVSATPSQTTKL